eukprot:4836647-Pleurochrysis_carterae.AAC.1
MVYSIIFYPRKTRRLAPFLHSWCCRGRYIVDSRRSQGMSPFCWRRKKLEKAVSADGDNSSQRPLKCKKYRLQRSVRCQSKA